MTFQSNADELRIADCKQHADWETFFGDAFANASPQERYSLPAEGCEFAHVAWPLVELSTKPIGQKITQLWQLGIIHPDHISSIYAEMVEPLWQTVFSKVSRTVVLEFSAAQATGLLDAQNGSNSYEIFAECLQDSEFSEALLRRNPLLCELTSAICQNWSVAALEFLEHLQTDWEQLNSHFSCEQNDTISAIRSSLGDTHRHGRSVRSIEFSNGRTLVYKPRNLAVEVHYRRFASWFNTACGSEMIRSVDALNMGSHGWCEHIDHRAVSDAGELADYFNRLGALLAIARVLGLTDLHSENLIAQGGWPIIIDLETLFHPLAGDLRPDATQPQASKALRRIHDTSVAATGLLPVRKTAASDGDNTINLAGMSDTAGQETPFAIPMWHDAGSNEMRLVEKHQTLTGDANVPMLDDQRISPEPYLDEVLEGFRKAYAVLEENRETLLSANGPLADFGSDPIRIVIRGTQTYLFLLADGSHPDLFESQQKKQSWFNDALKEANQSDILTTLRPSEMAALWRDDVPYFETTVNSQDILACDGQVMENRLPQIGMAITRQIITELGPEDMQRQFWLIKVALTKADHSITRSVASATSQPSSKQPQKGIQETALAVMQSAALEICEHALVTNGHASWFTVQEGSGGTLTAQLAGLDLYSGLPGIALFLSQAGRVLDDASIQTIAKAATVELLSALTLQQNTGMGLGGFSGTGGLLFALPLLAKEYPELECLEVSRQMMSTITNLQLSEAPLELVDGLAGLLLAIQHDHSSYALQKSIAGEIVDRLEKAIGNDETTHQLFAAAGMAHGAEGLQLALARASQNNDQKLKDICTKGLDLLEQLVRTAPELELRNIQDTPIAWCNGLAGKLLANDPNRHQGTEAIARELISRLEAHDYSDDSLCHGTMGTLQALQHVAPSLPESDAGKISSLTGEILTRLNLHGARCGTINGVFSPGLMDGMAGIGMAALGLADQQPASMIPLMSFNSLPITTRRAEST